MTHDKRARYVFNYGKIQVPVEVEFDDCFGGKQVTLYLDPRQITQNGKPIERLARLEILSLALSTRDYNPQKGNIRGFLSIYVHQSLIGLLKNISPEERTTHMHI